MRFAPIAAAALAAAGFAAQAQTAPPAAPGSAPMVMRDGRGPMDGTRMRERMQERMNRHVESLKRILQITPAQEGAWTAWASAIRPSPQMMQQRRADREALAQLSTPERIDRMRQMRAQRAAEMDRRGDATKTFYAQLSPAQQKAFDELSLRFMERHGRGGHRGAR